MSDWRPLRWKNPYFEVCHDIYETLVIATPYGLIVVNEPTRLTLDELEDGARIYEDGASAMYQPAYDKGRKDLLEELRERGKKEGPEHVDGLAP